MTGRVAFVSPRFGRTVLGGAETMLRELALGLRRRGWDVEVFTTCAVDHYTWANELPATTTVEEDLIVHRFENDGSRVAYSHEVHKRIVAGAPTTLDDQLHWLSFRFRIPDLFEALVRQGPTFDAVIFAPYLFWTTTVGVPAVAERAIVMPCLHDEGYARLDIMRHVLAMPAAVWFQSEPEHRLAHELGPVADRHSIPGSGVYVPEHYDPEGFRAKHGLHDPFLLFPGRRELDKGWPWLLKTFAEADLGPVKLVTVGVGEAEIPSSLRDSVIDLGFVSVQERNDALAAALACVQPSLLESYSRSVMESWLAGRPILVRRGSAVVEWHLERCGAGLAFGESAELASAVKQLVEDEAGARQLGADGRAYVLEHYQWDAVLDKMEVDLAALQGR
jgi:glycosyltransferase involved in cell wall biosynthesis